MDVENKILCPYCGHAHTPGTACVEASSEVLEFLEKATVDIMPKSPDEQVQLENINPNDDPEMKMFLLKEQVRYLIETNKRLRNQLNKKNKKGKKRAKR